MLNTVYSLFSQFSKSIGFDETNLYLSAAQYGEFENLKTECLSNLKKSSPTVPLHQIQKIVFSDHDGKMVIYFLKESGKKKNYALEGFDPNVKALFALDLAQAAGMLNHENPNAQSKTKDFTPFYLSIGGILIATTICAWFGSQPRVGYRSDFYKLMQNLGPSGVSVLGGIALLIIFYRMYKYGRKPADQNVYSR